MQTYPSKQYTRNQYE